MPGPARRRPSWWTRALPAAIEDARLDNFPNIVIAFLLTLGSVVVIHELGHFLTCKLFGVYVKTFSIGIGPKLLRKRWGETEYAISAIPFGGYVKMAGEGLMEEIQDTGTWQERKYPLGTLEGNAEAAGRDDHIPPERHFHSKPAWQRLLVFVAGPLANLLLAYALYLVLLVGVGRPQIPFTQVGAVRQDSPAAAAGLLVGDRILAVDGRPVSDWIALEDAILPALGTPADAAPAVTLTIERDGARQDVVLRPAVDPARDAWWTGLQPWNTTVGLVQKGGPAHRLGLREGDVIISVDGRTVTTFEGIAAIVNERPSEPTEVVWERDGRRLSGLVTPERDEVAPGQFKGRIFLEQYLTYEKVPLGDGLGLAWARTADTVRTTVSVFDDLWRGKLGLDAVGGPLRIANVAGEMLDWSFAYLIGFVAFFSVNLFLLNLLPIPVLDGGHVLFLLAEVARGGRPVPERLQAIATQVGLIVLLLFMVFVVVLDVWKMSGH
ncbi:RIP metalloprotease RseP [bacterium]|nr:RIP metalloprotease RseP [bacterium]